MSLNKSKPYSEVCGIGVAYKYEQDNKFFDQHGNEVTSNGKLVIGGEAKDPAAIIEKKPADDQQDDSYKGIALGGQEEETGDKKENPVPDINLNQVDGADVKAPDGDIEDLTIPEIKDQLGKLDVKFKANDSKGDLLALLRDELQARKIEAAQDDEKQDGAE